MSRNVKVLIGFLVVLVLALLVVVGYVVINGQTGLVTTAFVPAVASRPSCVGTWVAHFGGIYGDVKVELRSDGTGTWQAPQADISWQATESGFTATAKWNDPRNREYYFSGQLSEDGQRLMVDGWGGDSFGSGQSTQFNRF